MAKLHQPFTAKNQVMFIWEDELQNKMCVVFGQSGWVMVWADGLLQSVYIFWFMIFFMHAWSRMCVVLN